MIDGRSLEGLEQTVLRQVAQHGGFSIFWVTSNQGRAHAAERLQHSGRIIRHGGQYPWCAYVLPPTNA